MGPTLAMLTHTHSALPMQKSVMAGGDSSSAIASERQCCEMD